MNRQAPKKNINVVLTKEEYSRLLELANKSELVFSEFIRRTLSGAKEMRFTPI